MATRRATAGRATTPARRWWGITTAMAAGTARRGTRRTCRAAAARRSYAPAWATACSTASRPTERCWCRRSSHQELRLEHASQILTAGLLWLCLVRFVTLPRDVVSLLDE